MVKVRGVGAKNGLHGVCAHIFLECRQATPILQVWKERALGAKVDFGGAHALSLFSEEHHLSTECRQNFLVTVQYEVFMAINAYLIHCNP
jgi:hypothetical protein